MVRVKNLFMPICFLCRHEKIFTHPRPRCGTVARKEMVIIMKKRKTSALLLAALMAFSMLAGCSGDNGGSDTTTTTTTAATTAATLASEDQQVVEDLLSDVETLENPTVKWLSFWDINPAEGKAVPIDLELFKSKYGGEIEYIPTTWGEKYERLSTLVASGDSPDMFPAADMDVVPRGVIANLLQPIDSYVDFSNPIWNDMEVLNEKFVYQDKHYVAVTGVDAGVVCIYNQRTIEENGLADPAELFAEGNWTWDTFYDMIISFHNRDEGKFGIDGWWFEGALSLTTGAPYIGLENGVVVHNLDNPLIEKAQDFMYNLNRNDLPLPRAEFNWMEQPARIGGGQTLFYPVGIWALYVADLSNFGEMEDIRFVPMPRCPDADEYYATVGLSAYAMVAGAQNPEGVAAFMECARVADGSAEVAEIFQKQLYEDYGWTETMYEMLMTVREFTLQNPVIEFYTAVSPTVEELINNPMKQSYNGGESWTQTKESIRFALEAELEKANEKVTA